MLKRITLACTCLLALATTSLADEPAKESTKATFLITGLHCPPCTRTVEASLRASKGVRSVTVDWRTQNAKIEFDELQLPAQSLSRLIATTPHMMGGDMQYGGWLALKAEGVKDEKTAEAAKSALMKVPGVVKVVVYPAQESVGILFDAKGKATTAQLVTALSDAGVKANNLK